MAYYAGRGQAFLVDDTGGTLRAINGVTRIDGLPGDIQATESSAIGDSIVKSHPIRHDITFTVEGFYDDTASTGAATVLRAIWAEQLGSPSKTYTFEHGPEGSASGAPKNTGEAKIESYVEVGDPSQLMAFRASFRAQSITITGTFST